MLREQLPLFPVRIDPVGFMDRFCFLLTIIVMFCKSQIYKFNQSKIKPVPYIPLLTEEKRFYGTKDKFVGAAHLAAQKQGRQTGLPSKNPEDIIE